jgi:hypothetical protein
MGNIRNLKTAIPNLPDLVYTQVFINGSEVDVVKLNGTTYFRTNEAPTITYVTKTQTSITFKITNNNISARRIYYEIGDTTPDLAYVDLGANEQSINIVISGLTAGTNYTLYARSYYIAETDFSDVTAYTFTTAALQTAKPTIYNTAKTYVKPNYVVSWRVTNNDALVATIYTEIGDSTPDINYGSCASGSYITANETKTPVDFPVTIYAKAQASGKTLSTYDSEVVY